jgi:hypothetical protein
MNQKEQYDLDDYITQEEREHFLNGLHRYLVWVGEKIPDEVEVNGKSIKLHELVWRCIHKKQLSEQEKKRLLELINLLETKEKHDEETLRKANLTHEEAKKLYDESASLMRAIMDLRECESGKIRLKESSDEIKRKIDDARRWISFLKNVGKKSNL